MLNKKLFFGGLLAYGLLFNLAVVFSSFSAALSVIVSFPFLAVAPGLLTLLVFKVRLTDFWRTLCYAVALSIVVLMAIGLVVNTVLPLAHIAQPLSKVPLLLSLDAVMLALGIFAYRSTYSLQIATGFTWRKALSYLAPLGLVVLSVLGATSLNNGGPNALTIIMLLGVLADFLYVCKNANKLPRNLLIFHIFCWSLALLFMTSLRGWYITGHDIQREFYVFQLTHFNWHWDIESLKDPYNACLSITVLPTMLASLINIGDSYIYKLLFQILFAFCPVGVYLLARGLASRRVALLATLYFVAFPTFFIDMSMLNRQEVAFLLFTCMLLVLTDRYQQYAQRLMLFIVFGAGVVVAHYSTTYSLIAILGAACCVRFIWERKWFHKLASWLYRLIKRPVPSFITGRRQKHRLIIFPVVILFAILAFLWNVQITQTSRGIYDTAKNALANISGNIREDMKSSDTKSSLFGGANEDPKEVVKGYAKQQEGLRSEVDDRSQLYSKETYANFPLSPAVDAPLTPTVLGNFLNSHGLNIFDANYTLRQGFAKVLQVLVILGLCALFFSKRHKLHMGTELMAVSVTSIVFLLLLVLIPVLSVDYGLLRAFQQVLIVLALPTVLGSFVIFSMFKEKIMMYLAIGAASIFFVTSTGLVAEATGGYVAQLHLHNAGLYYDGYYIHSGEVRAMDWLDSRQKLTTGSVQAGIEADRFAVSKFLSVVGYRSTQNGIYPGLVTKDAYVYLGYNNVIKGSAYALYNNSGFVYNYPVRFLDDNKNLVYSNGQARIYR